MKHKRSAERAATRPQRGDRSAREAARPASNGLLWRSALIVSVCFATYWNSLDGPFISDDLISIARSRQIREWWSLTSMLFPMQDTSFSGRPLVHFSFALNYAFGALNVRGYHIANIVVHACCALLVFAVVRRTLRLPTLEPRFGGTATSLGFATALIWAVHPLNSDPVDYLTQRTESMMALFFLLTVYSAIRAHGSGRRLAWHIGAVLSCACGMACKESMVTAPAIVLLYDRVYVFGSFRQALQSRWRLYAGLAATWLVLVALAATDPRGEPSGFSSDVTPWTYLLNQTVIITQYLRLVLWPRNLVLDYGWTLPLTVRDVWPYGLAIVALLVVTVAVLIKEPRLGFPGAWFFITLSPTSSIVPIANEVGRECRMYLPMVALVALAVVGSAMVWDWMKRAWPAMPSWLTRPNVLGGSLLVVLSTALAAATVARNRDYRSAVVLYQTMVDRWPTGRTHHILASELLQVGRREEAIPHLRAAADAVPWARHDLGFELIRNGKFDEGIEHLQKVVDIWATPPVSHPHWQKPLRIHALSARYMIGQALARQQRWSEAAEQYRLALAIDPAYADAIGGLGETLLKQEAYEDAAARYREFLKLRPNDAVALGNLGVALISTGQLDAAIAMFRQAASLDPRHNERHLANALFDKGEMDEALVHARQAVAAAPDDAWSYDVLGRTLAVQGQYRDAIVQFERALRIDPAHQDAREHLARVRAVARQ